EGRTPRTEGQCLGVSALHARRRAGDFLGHEHRLHASHPSRDPLVGTRRLLREASERSRGRRPAERRTTLALVHRSVSDRSRDRAAPARGRGAVRQRRADVDGPSARRSRTERMMRPRHPRDPYWMMLPTAALLAVFFFYPLLFAAYTSLFRWDLLTDPVFVGLANYRVLLESGELGHAFLTTLSFSVVVVAGSMSLGLVLALALNRPGKFP